ncbi:IS3 family transposase [Salinisphaera japonica]|uniref:IS3 family transposase n=1 Tax=Salinisphaera japonica TaxID=1304270 RepID=UPI000F4BE353
MIEKVHTLHRGSNGVFGVRRITEILQLEGETISRNRVPRVMGASRLQGIPRRRRWQGKSTGVRPDHVRNHLERYFEVLEVNTKWLTDVTYIRTTERWFYLRVLSISIKTSWAVGR